MNIINFVSEKRKSFFAPEWNYFLGEIQLHDINFDKIGKYVLKKEKEIVEKYPVANKISVDGYTGLGENSLTSRYENFNVFSWNEKEVQKLKKKIHENYVEFLKVFDAPRHKVWIRCWANVMRNGEQILPHIHSVTPYTYLGGHVIVQTEESSTIYINPINQINDPELYVSENVVGKLTFFQNNIPHYTTKYNGKKERITIAFDLVVDEDPNNSKKNLILFDGE